MFKVQHKNRGTIHTVYGVKEDGSSVMFLMDDGDRIFSCWEWVCAKDYHPVD